MLDGDHDYFCGWQVAGFIRYRGWEADVRRVESVLLWSVGGWLVDFNKCRQDGMDEPVVDIECQSLRLKGRPKVVFAASASFNAELRWIRVMQIVIEEMGIGGGGCGIDVVSTTWLRIIIIRLDIQMDADS